MEDISLGPQNNLSTGQDKNTASSWHTIKQMEHREGKVLTQGHTAWVGQSEDKNPDLQLPVSL